VRTKLTLMAAACAVVCGSASLRAQGQATERQQLELTRAQRALQQTRADIDRLLDLRVRHDLGLPGDADDPTFRTNGPVTTEELDRLQKELDNENIATATLTEGYDKVRAAVERLRAEAEAISSKGAPVRAPVDVPPAGSRATAPAAAPTAETAGGVAVPVADAAARPSAAIAPAIDLGPLRAQIHGSSDHQRVAQSLFKAGQALMDRAAIAREQAQPDVATELDARAKERLVRAIDELAPLLQQQPPPYETLFYLGRSRELLFRHAERYDGLSLAASAREYQKREQDVREPFLAITARDVRAVGKRGEAEVLGAWGMAAQAAMVHFTWMNQHAGYDARNVIDALTWPGEHEQ
jgi:hypothetical protein